MSILTLSESVTFKKKSLNMFAIPVRPFFFSNDYLEGSSGLTGIEFAVVMKFHSLGTPFDETIFKYCNYHQNRINRVYFLDTCSKWPYDITHR